MGRSSPISTWPSPVIIQEHPGSIDRFGGGGEFYLRIPAMKSGRHPDLGVVLVDTPLDDRGRDKPSLVAEVVSARSKTRDYESKREEYLAFGVREYWIVDPYKRQVTVLVRRDAGEVGDLGRARHRRGCRHRQRRTAGVRRHGGRTLARGPAGRRGPMGPREGRRRQASGLLDEKNPCQAEYSWNWCCDCVSSTGSDSTARARVRSGCAYVLIFEASGFEFGSLACPAKEEAGVMGTVQDDRFDRGGPFRGEGIGPRTFFGQGPHFGLESPDRSIDFAPKLPRFGTANLRAEESVS